MHLSELKSAGRSPSLPLSLELADAAGPAQLQLLSLLRVLPGQRYVGAGVWRGRPVLAKLLVGSKAARHFQRELQGVRLLAEQGLTTPLLLADGLKEGEGGWLLFELLEDAESLGDVWKQVEHLPLLADEQTAVLAEALGATDVPASEAEVDAYFAQQHSALLFDARSREVLEVLSGIRLPVPMAGLSRELFLGAGAALLPDWATTMIERTPMQRAQSRASAVVLKGMAPLFRRALQDGLATRACTRMGVPAGVLADWP